MKEHNYTVDTSVQTGGQADFQISIKNFGPIESGSVAFRPLTVFVGPSIQARHTLLLSFMRFAW